MQHEQVFRGELLFAVNVREVLAVGGVRRHCDLVDGSGNVRMRGVNWRDVEPEQPPPPQS